LLLHFYGFSNDYIRVKTKWTVSQDMYGGKIWAKCTLNVTAPKKISKVCGNVDPKV